MDPRVRTRFTQEAERLRTGYTAALWAMEKYLRQSNVDVSERIRSLRTTIEHEFGQWSKAFSRVVGPVLLWSARREAARYPAGRPLEPHTFLEPRLKA